MEHKTPKDRVDEITEEVSQKNDPTSFDSVLVTRACLGDNTWDSDGKVESRLWNLERVGLSLKSLVGRTIKDVVVTMAYDEVYNVDENIASVQVILEPLPDENSAP